MRAAIALAALAACGSHDDAKPAPPAPAPAPAPGPTDAGPRPTGLAWRLPIVTITPTTFTLTWRSGGGVDEAALTLPLAQWTCDALRAQLALEVTRTWPNTVRPTRSKQLLLVADHDAPDAFVMKVTDCAQDRTGVRQLYPDVMLVPQ